MNPITTAIQGLYDPIIVSIYTNPDYRARFKYLLDISPYNLISNNVSQFTNDSHYTPCLYTQTSSVTIANTIAETSFLTSTTTLPANYLLFGRQFMVRVRGFHSAVANPTIRVRVYLNSTVVLDTGVKSSGNGTNDYWDMEGVVNCRSTGQTGTVMGQGFYLETGGGSNHFGMVNLSPITIDTTIPQTINVTVQWGTASNSNTITATNGYILIMK